MPMDMDWASGENSLLPDDGKDGFYDPFFGFGKDKYPTIYDKKLTDKEDLKQPVLKAAYGGKEESTATQKTKEPQLKATFSPTSRRSTRNKVPPIDKHHSTVASSKSSKAFVTKSLQTAKVTKTNKGLHVTLTTTPSELAVRSKSTVYQTTVTNATMGTNFHGPSTPALSGTSSPGLPGTSTPGLPETFKQESYDNVSAWLLPMAVCTVCLFVLGLAIVVIIVARRCHRAFHPPVVTSASDDEMYAQYKLSKNIDNRPPIPEPRDLAPDPRDLLPEVLDSPPLIQHLPGRRTESCVYASIEAREVTKSYSFPRRRKDDPLPPAPGEYLEFVVPDTYDYAESPVASPDCIMIPAEEGDTVS